jgi:oxygen-independent coproporphyrinogen III oxidase
MANSLDILVPAPEAVPVMGRLPAVTVPGLYVHIPFCRHKCHYCDFYSITGQTTERMGEFVDRLLKEAAVWTGDSGPRLQPRTVFFGGGTPTLLPVEEMRRLIVGLRAAFDFSACDEWTVEANPATVTAEYCRMLREQGVTRLSFGAQSFDPAELAMLERHHDPADVGASVRLARAAGFERINVDLIYAICGQNLESWARSLDAAIALGTEHVSCYGLTYEPGTPLTARKQMGSVQPVEPEAELEMMAHARRRLAQAGLPAYEISNYARPGEACRHNLLYWTGGDYISLGPSAASHVRGFRWKNQGHLGRWEQAIDRGETAATEMEHLSPRRRAGELAMLTLRLSRGLVFDDYLPRFGLDGRELFAETAARLSKMGLVQVDDAGVRLTERGLAVADSIAGEFLLDDGQETEL